MSEEMSGVGCRESEPRMSDNAPTADGQQPTASEPNWRLIYSAVIIELAILIVIFYIFTKAFA
jgi:heme/copper-type cytochrome/quinol oxidase subunit 2